jgi:hypothetical protein
VRALALSLAVVLGIVATPAPAQQVKVKKLYAAALPWGIPKAQQALMAPTWVDHSTAFLEIQMQPLNLFETQAAVRTTAGKTLVPEKTQLVRFISPIPVLCTINASDSPKFGEFFQKYGRANTCFEDMDGDGYYEQYVDSPYIGIWGNFYLTKKNFLNEKFAPTPIDPAAAELKINMHVQYTYFAGGADALIFQTCIFKNVKWRDLGCIGREIAVKRSALPQTFEALGATFSVDAKDGERVLVRQLTPVPARPVIIQ